MKRMIDADRYEAQLHALLQIVREDGAIADDIACGIELAIQQLHAEPRFTTATTQHQKIVQHAHIPNTHKNGHIDAVKRDMVHELGEYARDEKIAQFEEQDEEPYPGCTTITMRATFLVPEEPEWRIREAFERSQATERALLQRKQAEQDRLEQMNAHLRSPASGVNVCIFNAHGATADERKARCAEHAGHCAACIAALLEEREEPQAYNPAHRGAVTAEQFEAIWNDDSGEEEQV